MLCKTYISTNINNNPIDMNEIYVAIIENR